MPKISWPGSMHENVQPTHQRQYYPMGEALLFQTNSSALLNAAEESFGRFPTCAVTNQRPLVLRLFVHPAERTPQRLGSETQPIYRTQGHMYYITAGGGNTAVADLLQGYAFGYVTPDAASDEAFVRYVFLEGVVFCMLQPARHCIGLHAACVVVNNTSIILQGHAGAGKSTLAYACARNGYQVLAEDGMVLKVRPDGVQLWGAPWRLHLMPDSIRFFPELRQERPRVQINGEWKLEVNLEAYWPGSTVTEAPPGIVVLLDRSAAPGETTVEALPLEKALDQFSVVWPYAVGWTEEMEWQLSRLLDGHVYRLVVNGTPEQATIALDELVSVVATPP